MDYFIYNGIDSRDFGLYVVNDGQLKSNLSPPKQSYTVDIPSINGLILTNQKYNPRRIRLRCVLNDTSTSNKNLIMSWLSQLNEGELILSYESYKVYVTTFENELNMENYSGKGVFYLDFISYNPISKSRVKTVSDPALEYNGDNFYNTGLIYGLSAEDYTFKNITTQTDVEIYHGGTVDGALPIININGSADSLKITQYKTSDMVNIHREFNYGAFSGNLKVDCEVRNTFLNDALNNESFEGKYLELFGRTKWGRLSNGLIKAIDDINNELTLPDSESSTDDLYNGHVIIIRSGEDIKYFKILDYDGTTKILTLENSDLSDIKVDVDYSIYDVADGLNYIRIDGTNLNINEINFDFNFIYL